MGRSAKKQIYTLLHDQRITEDPFSDTRPPLPHLLRQCRALSLLDMSYVVA